MTSEKTATRRRYSRELKAQILAECALPGTSVAKVALTHGINANVVHGWRKVARESRGAATSERFVPVVVEPVAPPAGDERCIEVELRRGAVSVKLSWPMSAAMDLSAWMRELLR